MTDGRTTEEDHAFQSRITQAVIRLALLALLVFLCLRVLNPFINPIIGGIVIAIALHTPYQNLSRAIGGRRRLAAVFLVLLILLALTVPAIALGANLVEGAHDLAENFVPDEIVVSPPPESVAEWPLVGRYVYDGWLTASRNLESVLVKTAPYMKDVGLWMIEMMGDLGWGLVMFIVAIVIAGALLPVKEQGVAMTRKVASIIAGERGPQITDLVASSVQSVVKGVIGVAVIQSLLAGLGMLVAGVPAAGLWALLILILAVMQLPAMLVLLPVILYVFATSSTTTAVLFAIWALLVGMSDNLLKPLLMGRGSRTPMLVLFMGSLGGFMAGGILGLFVGAVVLSIGYTVFMAWLEESNVSAEGAPES
jgi:predicted PurR-regulated permease PerM